MIRLNLAALMSRYSVKAKDLAQCMECSVPTVYTWMNDERWPSKENLELMLLGLRQLGTPEVVKALPVRLDELIVEVINDDLDE